MPANARSTQASAADQFPYNRNNVDLTSPTGDNVIDMLEDDGDDGNFFDVEEMERPAVACAAGHPDANQWACSRCTLLNANWQTQCSACYFSQPIAVGDASSAARDGIRRPDPEGNALLLDWSPDDSWMSYATVVSSPRTAQSTAAQPLGFLSGGALLGGVLGATGAYLRGQPVAASAMEGAVSGAVSGAVLQEVLGHQQLRSENFREVVEVAEEPTVHRTQNSRRNTLTFRRVPRATTQNNAPPRRTRRTSFTRSGRRGSSGNDTSFDDAVMQYMMRLEGALSGLQAHQNIDSMSYDQLLQAFGDGGENLGGSEYDIQRLPVVTLRDPVIELPEDCRQCHICLESFGAGDQRKTLPCLHGFHQACADKWLRTNGSCPVCKHKIGTSTPEP
jgi:hypothetical protein